MLPAQGDGNIPFQYIQFRCYVNIMLPAQGDGNNRGLASSQTPDYVNIMLPAQGDGNDVKLSLIS